MRSLEEIRSNYFYDDWGEIESSTHMAAEVRNMPSRGEATDRARSRWASLLEQGALFKRSRWVNWRVPPEAYPLPPGLIDEFQTLGQLVDRFLQGVDAAMGENSLIREALGFPACPEEDLLWLAYRGTPLTFFRLDLAYDQDHRLRLLEIQVVAGGLGITQALRTSYGAHPALSGISESYQSAVISGFRRWLGSVESNIQSPPLIAVAGARRSSYRHDHLVLARHLRDLELTVIPLHLLSQEARGRSFLPDGRTINVIHRLFRSPSLFQRQPTLACALLNAIQNHEVFVINPWKDMLEDKRLLALIHHPELADGSLYGLTPEQWDRMRELVPDTQLATPEAISKLLGQPRSGRSYYLKKGRSFESRQLYDGQQVNLRQWDAACLRAREEGDWIIQQTVHTPVHSLAYLDFKAQEVRSMKGHIRLSPFYFRDENMDVVLGDILMTAREGRSRVHGASDAILLVPGQ